MDYSYSGITEKLQGDKEEGRKFLIGLSHQYVFYKEKIERQMELLKELETKKNLLRAGINNAMQHLKLEKPLAIILNKELIVISESDVTFETNVL